MRSKYFQTNNDYSIINTKEEILKINKRKKDGDTFKTDPIFWHPGDQVLEGTALLAINGIKK